MSARADPRGGRSAMVVPTATSKHLPCACSRQLSLSKMANNPDWVFYRHDGPTEAEVMTQLLAGFPGFRPRWEKHLASWDGEPAGNYIDIGEFVYFVVEDLYPSGKSEEVQRAFDLMENWLMNGHVNVQELVVIGFLEDLQNLASQQPFGKEAFIPFLGPKSREGWDDLEKFWEGKGAFSEGSGPT